MRIPSISTPLTATTVLWGALLWFACPTLAQEDAECPNGYAGQCPPYSVDTGPEEWNQCSELDGWTEQCHPTVSIERAACLAPLVANARVVTTVWDPAEPDYGNAKIEISFNRPTNETDTFGILKSPLDPPTPPLMTLTGMFPTEMFSPEMTGP